MRGSRLPAQAPPVRRPDLIQPHSVVDLEQGEGDAIVTVLTELLHGANFNDPPALRRPSFQRLAHS